MAYVISPVQAAQWINYRKEIRKAKENLAHPHWYKKYNPFTLLYHKVDEVAFPWLQREYVRTLTWTLKRETFVQLPLPALRSPFVRWWNVSHRGFTILAANAGFIVCILLFAAFNKGVEFFPNTEPSQATVTIEMAPESLPRDSWSENAMCWPSGEMRMWPIQPTVW